MKLNKYLILSILMISTAATYAINKYDTVVIPWIENKTSEAMDVAIKRRTIDQTATGPSRAKIEDIRSFQIAPGEKFSEIITLNYVNQNWDQLEIKSHRTDEAVSYIPSGNTWKVGLEVVKKDRKLELERTAFQESYLRNINNNSKDSIEYVINGRSYKMKAGEKATYTGSPIENVAIYRYSRIKVGDYTLQPGNNNIQITADYQIQKQ